MHISSCFFFPRLHPRHSFEGVVLSLIILSVGFIFLCQVVERISGAVLLVGSKRPTHVVWHSGRVWLQRLTGVRWLCLTLGHLHRSATLTKAMTKRPGPIPSFFAWIIGEESGIMPPRHSFENGIATMWRFLTYGKSTASASPGRAVFWRLASDVWSGVSFWII